MQEISYQEKISEIDLRNTQAWSERSSQLKNSFGIALETLKNSEEINYEKGIANSRKILGYCFWRFSDFTESLAHSLKALDVFKKLGDKKGEADTINNVGAVHMFRKEHKKRLQCNLDCLRIREEIDDKDGVSSSQNNIGETYMEMGNLESASTWFHTCLNNSNSSVQTKSWAWFNLGKVHLSQKDIQKCLEYFQLSLVNSLSVNYEVLATEIYLQQASVYLDMSDYYKAEESATSGLILAKKTGAKEELKNAYFILSMIKEAEGNILESLGYFKKYHITHTEIFNEFNAQKIKDIEFHHELDRISKEAEIERLKTVELKKAHEITEHQKKILEQRNREITDSLIYASKIQQAILKDEEHVSPHLPEHFILFKPKDIVSGDFYWAYEKNNSLFTAVADCTGHGVPGAFLTLLGTSFMNEITSHNEKITPAGILEELRDKIVKELSPDGESRDGMDISLLKIDLLTGEVLWAGANNSLWIIDANKNIQILEPDKQPIGFTEKPSKFSNHSLKPAKNSMIYLFTDGYADQFGGDSGRKGGKKFKKSQLLQLLKSISDLSVDKQKEVLQSEFERWKGEFEQVDDVCILGLRV